jgi:hypothetical protein
VVALASTGKDNVKLFVAFAAAAVGARRIVSGRGGATEERHSGGATLCHYGREETSGEYGVVKGKGMMPMIGKQLTLIAPIDQRSAQPDPVIYSVPSNSLEPFLRLSTAFQFFPCLS